LLPGYDNGRPIDLTRIAPGGYLWMTVEPVSETGSEARFDIVLDAPTTASSGWKASCAEQSGARWQ
jgi:hypothetical protein